MDYKKLSKVHDKVTGKSSTVTVKDRRVTVGKNPLDEMDDGSVRITDNTKPDVNNKEKVKYIVLDTSQIERIADMNSSDRRKFFRSPF